MALPQRPIEPRIDDSMRAILAILLLALAFAGANPASAARYAAVVIDADSGAVLHGARSRARRYPASLTKMMTLYLIFERLRNGAFELSTRMRVPHRATLQPASRLGLRQGSRISVREAIQALVVKSANDVATTVAYHIAGSERKFARLMNRKARQLGMRHTSFRNASGLWHSQQWTTARDMARLARALIHNFPQYYKYFSQKSFKFRGRAYRSHNRLLRSYPGADGLKTGYISKSGFNLAFSARRKGRRLITVVMGGRTGQRRDRQVALLTDRVFARLKPRPVPGGDNRLWAVQVGAVGDKAAARRMARKAAQIAGLPHGGAWGAWSRTRSKGGRLYLARRVGYEKAAADRACSKLRRRRTDCFVLRHKAPPPLPVPAPTAVAAAPAPQKAPPAAKRKLPPMAALPRLPPYAAGAGGGYAIQVGVYSSRTAARRRAQSAVHLLRSLPAGVYAGAWPTTASSGRKLYQARLTGFEKSAARRACDDLKRKKQECLVLLLRSGRRART